MALTVTTDLVNITTAETITGWTGIQTSGGSTVQLEPDFFAQGGNSISRAVTGISVFRGAMFDFGSGINFTSGADQDKMVYVWMRTNVAALNETREARGVVVRLSSSSATTNYREWNVDGSDTVAANQGWTCYVIDPQSAGSVDSGTYVATGVRFFGGYATTIATAKGQNWGIDRISYGRGELRVTGTVTTAGEGFKEISNFDWGDISTGRWGIITEKSGVFYVRGKIIIGSTTADTTFSSQGEQVIFETPVYGRQGSPTESVRSIPDASVGGTLGFDGSASYLGLAFLGGDAGSPGGATQIDIGAVVGSDGGRSGTSFVVEQNQTTLTPSRTRATISTNNGVMALSLYGATFTGFEGAIDLRGTGIDDDDCFGCTFSACGRIDTNMEVRRTNILNSVVTPGDGALLWSSDTNVANSVFAGNSKAIVFEQTTGTPFTFTNMTFAGNTVDVMNASGGSIIINVITSTTPSVENTGSPNSATTLVIDPVTVIVTAQDASGTIITGVNVFVAAANPGSPTFGLPWHEPVTITNANGLATVAHTAHGMSSGDKVLIRGVDQAEYRGVHTITLVDANSYTYPLGSPSPASPATGSIDATFVLIFGLVDGSGKISMSRSFSVAQPVTGQGRKSSGTPYYQSAPLAGTVDITSGLSLTAVMISDE